ncbi:TMEM165/GDT1 family protein [Dechloromonas sp. XY25]|uniref:GDT1 family protein n=1 Tax=Dechloromonas hankyongensis TaxID=2908002 RepID=A0ABS9K0W4_9RHOO|nr:TMEM165/GDT1 family protein [Dechloromonas hankyongensis]MCG2576794.1 TMEM165/GDT1 family protein [Dechloromonas hankyongensis]
MPDFVAAHAAAWLSSAGATYLLIALAEFGDKSQLVCMTLAARHRGLPVVIGAVAAFAILNLLAVLFGAAVAAWLPEWAVTLAVAMLFAFFGVQALRFEEEDDDEEIEEKPGHGIVATTFLMIFVAEFGDKTQIAVAGMGSAAAPAATWVGATLALATTSVLGVYAGRRFLQRLPLNWIHRVSGVFFLVLALLAALRLFGLI